MKFFTFIRHAESSRDLTIPPALEKAMGEFMERSVKAGTLVDTGGLSPTRQGKRIRIAKGKMQVTDGPFTEAKEVIGGWAILEAPTMEEAMKVATEFMEIHRKHWPEFEGESEVRPMEFKMIP